MNEIKRQLKMKIGDTTHQQRNVVNKIQQQSIASAKKNKHFAPVLLSIVVLATTLFFVFSMAKENETEIYTHTAANEQIVETVTVIEVLHWETNDLITDITDTEYIEKLIEELNSAKTVSTKTTKIPSADYNLLIIRNGETVYQVGYYKDVMKLDGLESRYLDLKEEKMYGVTLELPINN